ncbi:MAG TPA: glycosyltransferase [Candidatus Acidoferrales bacterium]|nr:glycosyltransferase [Candidatus Acidoferrales bacterium]
MNRIKVVQIVPMLSPGGAERVAVHIARGLNRRRYEPIVISFTGRVGCDLDHMLEEAGIEVRYLGKRPGFDYRVYSRLDSALKECEPDVIHTHLHVLRYALPSMLLMKRVSMVHTVHNLAEREIEPRARLIQRYALTHGVKPIAVAEEVAASIESLYGIQNCRVISNCIPTDVYASPPTPRKDWRSKEGFKDSDILFVCVARFAPQKNQALLLKSFAQGPASDPHAHLVLVGEGDLRKGLEEQARDLGLGGKVHFLGLRSDIPEVLGAMDVFVLSSDYEGNPLSVLEAMASGLPIVSTAAGGVPNLFESGKEGFLVPPGDLQGLAKSMNSFLKYQAARESMGAAAARRARESFDLSTMVRAYEQVYEELLAQSHRRNAQSLLRGPAIPAEEGLGSRHH